MNFDRSRRILFGALAASLLLHLLLVFGWGWVRPLPAAVPQVAMQVLVSAREPSNPAAAPVQSRPEKVVTAAPKRQDESAMSPVLAVEKPAASVESVAPAPTPAPSGQGARVSSVPATSLATDAGKAGAAHEGVSADGLRQYRIELASAARRFRHYPALARTRGWEGVAEISLTVTAGVPSPSLKLVRSSGYEVLDEQAIEMLSRAAASTPLPDSLRGRSFVVPMPIRFSLEE